MIDFLNKKSGFDRATLGLAVAGLAAGIVMTVFVTGCTSSASRIAECEAQGISRDTCYLSEQNRKQGVNAAAEKQAMENAAAVQHAQTAHMEHAKAAPYKPGSNKPIHVSKNGIDFKRSADGFAYINGELAAKDEDNADATTYSGGLWTVIVYKRTGRINAIEDGKDITRLK